MVELSLSFLIVHENNRNQFVILERKKKARLSLGKGTKRNQTKELPFEFVFCFVQKRFGVSFKEFHNYRVGAMLYVEPSSMFLRTRRHGPAVFPGGVANFCLFAVTCMQRHDILAVSCHLNSGACVS